ncbi:MAG: NTP transferase domain-containing protein [Candidatus Binatales bacterium]
MASASRNIEGILLAAGESRRMGYPKPMLEIDGRTFVDRLSAAMLESVSRVIVVLGAHAERVRRAIPDDDPRIVIIENRDYARGQLSSLKTGLSQVGAQARAVMVHLVDHPAVGAATFAGLIAEYERSGKPIVIARFRARRGHPVIFDRSVFRELMDAPFDQGARAVVNADPGRVGYLEAADPGVVMDLDTPEDLERARLPLPPSAR